MFSHSGQELLLTTGTGDVKILSHPEFELLYSVPAHTSACYTLDLSPHGKHMVVGGSDALVSLWDTYEWVSKHILVATEGPVRSVGFSFDGSFVCVGSDEATGIDLVCFIANSIHDGVNQLDFSRKSRDVISTNGHLLTA